MTISRQLTMVEVATALGWVGDDGAPSKTDLLRLRRRLRSAEKLTGKALIFGGGGGRCWTTINALRTAGLLDDWADMTSAIRDKVDEHAELIDLLDERQRGIARALAKQIQQARALQRKLDALMVAGGIARERQETP